MGFIDDNALSRGAAIAYYTVFSIAPMLVIVVAIAGLAFGQEAAEGALVGQLRGMMGDQAAEFLQTALSSASNHQSGIIATIIGFATLLITATGVFGEMQASLNAIWKVEPPTGLTSLLKTRALSLGLVAALGFLLLTSLVASAAITALGHVMDRFLPDASLILQAINFVVSLAMISVLFGAIYKILPDTHLAWRDVMVGAVVTALLFTIGKTAIGLYIGSSSIATSYGAAGALVIVLLWIYYSSQIFLLGAEFTKSYAARHGSTHGKMAAAGAGGQTAVDLVPVSHPALRRGAFSLVDVVALGALVWIAVKSRRQQG
jgi:membrane protein